MISIVVVAVAVVAYRQDGTKQQQKAPRETGHENVILPAKKHSVIQFADQLLRMMEWVTIAM